MEVDIKFKYWLDMIIFIFIPFIIYVVFSIYFWYKKFQYKKIHIASRSKQMSKELKYIIFISYVYIGLNFCTGMFALYNTLASRSELQTNPVSPLRSAPLPWTWQSLFTHHPIPKIGTAISSSEEV
jgi:hypothetical protein